MTFTFNIVIILILFIGLLFFQYNCGKNRSKILACIFPVLFFILTIVFFVGAYNFSNGYLVNYFKPITIFESTSMSAINSTKTNSEFVSSLLIHFLLSNIPTVILILMYFIGKKMNRRIFS